MSPKSPILKARSPFQFFLENFLTSIFRFSVWKNINKNHRLQKNCIGSIFSKFLKMFNFSSKNRFLKPESPLQFFFENFLTSFFRFTACQNINKIHCLQKICIGSIISKFLKIAYFSHKNQIFEAGAPPLEIFWEFFNINFLTQRMPIHKKIISPLKKTKIWSKSIHPIIYTP